MKRISTLLAASAFFAVGFLSNSAMAQDDAERFNYDNKTYEIVEQKMNWVDAAKYAKAKGGYLVEINSKEEQEAIYQELVTNSKVSATYTSVMDGGGVAYVWIGANDKASEGEWKWDGDNDGNGNVFWTGQGANGTGEGKSVEDRYQNWGGNAGQGSANEPDDYLGKQDAAAFALDAWPKGAGFLGSVGEWNDINEKNELYFIIEYDYADVPAKTSIVDGISDACPDVAYEYLCSETEGAAAFEWIVNPESAANIVAHGNFAVITWNSGYSGSVSVQARAYNPIGAGEVSEAYEVILHDYPPAPEQPVGDTLVHPDTQSESIYTLQPVSTADEYVWEIAPIDAGELDNKLDTLIITWNEKFEGDVYISVRSKNSCGTSDYAEMLKVKLEPSVSVEESSDTDISVFPNPSGGKFTIQNLKFSEYTIEIFDISGKRIYQTRATSEQYNVNLNQSGVYLVKISSDNRSETHMVIVK